MPRTSTLSFRQISFAQAAGDGILHLIEINHPSFGSPPEPIRLARNPVDVTSNGETYTAWAFDLVMPALRDDGGFTQAKLQIDVVNRQIIQVLRNLTTPATVTHFTVRIGDADEVTHGPWVYQVRGRQPFDRSSMTLLLGFEPVREEECPWKRLSPSRAPGLF